MHSDDQRSCSAMQAQAKEEAIRATMAADPDKTECVFRTAFDELMHMNGAAFQLLRPCNSLCHCVRQSLSSDC